MRHLLRRSRLVSLTVEVLRPAHGARPEVRVVEVLGRQLVVKDFASESNRFKRALGAFLIGREAHAYERLGDIPGIPRFFGRLDRHALVLERCDAAPAYPSLPAVAVPDFLHRLRILVSTIHGRGVAHGDMRNPNNILVAPDGAPVLVDFTASFVAGSDPFAALVFPLLADDDLRGILKLKEWLTPEAITAQERAFMEYRSPAEVFFRSWREYVRQGVQHWSRRGNGAG